MRQHTDLFGASNDYDDDSTGAAVAAVAAGEIPWQLGEIYCSHHFETPAFVTLFHNVRSLYGFTPHHATQCAYLHKHRFQLHRLHILPTYEWQVFTTLHMELRI